MKSIIVALVLCSSFPAMAAAPIDFFNKAIWKMDPDGKDAKIVTTYDPFKYASRVLQYIDRLAQHTIDAQRMAWSFYRFQYTQKDGAIQDCVGGIGYKLGYPETRRYIDIEQCNQDFFHDTTQFEGEIDLTK